jgi:glutathione synthase/RimK-type ligase-like ATP-grasp enzyme
MKSHSKPKPNGNRGRQARKPLSIRYVTSKWAKTKVLLKNPTLREAVPDTQKMTKESLRKLLQLYNMVYIKPNRGTFGNGVMRIELNPGELQPYRYQKGVKIKTFGDLDAMYRSIREDTRNRPYLVQKGIDLLKYNDRRFDIRVMVQQNPKCKWETTAMIGRVADPRKIVTNFHNGGTLMPVVCPKKSR